jgi:hypothetical protein
MGLRELRKGNSVKIADSAQPITYRFCFDDDGEKCYTVQLDPHTLAITDPPKESLPVWTQLDYQQCPTCPLDRDQHPHCPIAARIVDLVEGFRDVRSFDAVTVIVETANRTFRHETSVQKGLSSILGIYMVSSGCPIMDRLRPMVEFHLPFATMTETTYRTISMYVMAQFFRRRRGEDPDLDLVRLPDLLENVRQVDLSFCRRVSTLGVEDASLNALVILTTFGEVVNFTLGHQDLEHWERLFAAYCD